MPIDNTYTLPKESSRNSALALPPNLETDAIICIYNHRTTKTNQKYPSVNL